MSAKPRVPNEVTVRVGQIWADNDPRNAGRTLRVDAVAAGKALCTTLTNADDQQRGLDGVGRLPKSWYTDRRGKQTKISLKRFKPNATGYRLVEDAPTRCESCDRVLPASEARAGYTTCEHCDARFAVEALPKGPPEC